MAFRRVDTNGNNTKSVNKGKDTLSVDTKSNKEHLKPVRAKNGARNVAKVGKHEQTTPFGMCKTHNVFYKSCHC